VTATGPVSRWQVSFEAPGTTSVSNAWGMSCRLSGTTVTCQSADWASTLAPGQTVRVGLQAVATKAPSSPKLSVAAS
jgi:endoglucanase